MRELLLVRYGEVHLKGQNRPYFLRTLVNAVRRAVREIGGNVWISDSRIFVSDARDMDECIRRVTKVFGVHSVCPAIEMEKDDFDAVCAQAVQMMRPLSGTFKVNARRSDKRYPIDSPEINRRVGERVLEALPGLRVDVHSPDHVLSVEIRDKAYLYVRCIPAVNGMPLGTNGRACLLLSGGIDSPVAGFMIAKRGVEICCVHYHSFPYTSERAKEKVVDLAKILSVYAGAIKLHVVPFTDIQLSIIENCPKEYLTIIMRRLMMRIAEKIARQNGSLALITGESVGQVASQTMESLYCTDSAVNMPVFRPCIGMDKEEIVRISKKIDAYETSIQPYEDCCTIFVPKHPKTKPSLGEIVKAEENLGDVEAALDKAIADTEVIEVKYPR